MPERESRHTQDPEGPDGGDPALTALSEAVLAVTAEHDVVDVLQAIVDQGRQLVDARYAALGVPNRGGDGLERFLVSGISPEQMLAIGRHPAGRGLLGIMRREARSVRIADIGADPRSVGFPPRHPPMTSFLGVPIKRGEETLGELYFTDKQGAAAFSAEDQAQVEDLARHAAQAITNARLIQRLAESERRYRLLTEGAPEIVFALDRVGRITFMNDRVREVTGGQRGQFMGRLFRDMVVPDDRAVVDLHLRAMRGGAQRTSFDVSAPDVRGVIHHFEISLVPGAGDDSAFQGIARDVTEQRTMARQITERTTELLSSQEERQQLREFVSLVIQAQEDERARIAGDLHDTTVQTLTAIGRRLHSLAANGARQGEALGEELAELAEAALAEGEEVRRLSRNLRPSVLDHLGLAAGLEHLAAELRETGLLVSLTVEGEAGRLDDQQRTALFRIAQEALGNVRRHSGADEVHIQLRVGDDEVLLVVHDNGRGFDLESSSATPETGSARLGLAGMRERAAMLGGQLVIDTAPGAGTRVTMHLPLER
jgi:PAS domain S-box-containing protein